MLIPCFNEELTVGKVVTDFARVLPSATIFVFDNNSTDATGQVAAKSGATVINAPQQGKGHVIQQMFSTVDADIYLIVDGDATYPASYAPDLIRELTTKGVDMVVGTRTSTFQDGAFRRFHQFGNRLVASIISRLFFVKVTDVMSGYRVLSQDFVKTVPLSSVGFEVETEMTLQALAKNFVISEIPIPYGKRPKGSHSKLNTFSDGFVVLKSIFIIFKDFKPLKFFSLLSGFLLFVTLAAGTLPILDYLQTGYVKHVPLAILATGTAILTALSFGIGLILDTVAKYQSETFEILRRLSKKN